MMSRPPTIMTVTLTTPIKNVDAMLTIAEEATQHPQRLTSAPHTTPIGRMDEVSANRNLDVRWRPK